MSEKLPEETEQLLQELLHQNLTLKEIAQRAGVSVSSVRNRAQRTPGWKPRPHGHPNSPDHPWRKAGPGVP